MRRAVEEFRRTVQDVESGLKQVERKACILEEAEGGGTISLMMQAAQQVIGQHAGMKAEAIAALDSQASEAELLQQSLRVLQDSYAALQHQLGDAL